MHSATPTGECRSWNAHASLLCTLLLIALLLGGCGKEAVYLAAGSESGSAMDVSESEDETADASADDAGNVSGGETEAGDDGESDADVSSGLSADGDSDVAVSSGSSADSDSDVAVSSESDADSSDSYIYVYVCGAVESPGLYQLEQGSRVYDAITAAGGLRDDACEDYWNQAACVSDGQMIDVPTEAEVEASGSGSSGSSTDASSGSNASGGSMDASSGSGAAGSGTGDSSEADTSGSDSSSGTSSSGLININTATAEELMQIPGIGEARAEAIISYREENGGFSSIEDIKNVSGIGDALFDKMKNYIEV